MPDEKYIHELPAVAAAADLAGAVIEVEYGTQRPFLNKRASIGQVLEAATRNLPGTNGLKGTPKFVRFLDNTTPGYTAGASTLAGLNPETLCLHTTAHVDFTPDGNDVLYRLAYDPTGPLLVYADGNFTPPTLPARWVRQGDATATAGVEVFNPLSTRIPAGAQRLHDLNGRTRLFEAEVELLRASFPGNQIPAPTGTDADAGRWEEKPIGGQDYSPVVVIGWRGLQALLGAAQLVPYKWYRIVGRANPETLGGPLQVVEYLPDVLLFATDADQLAPEALLLDSPNLPGTYTVATDTFTPGGPAVVQSTGTSTTAVMSQDAVTDRVLNYFDADRRGADDAGNPLVLTEADCNRVLIVEGNDITLPPATAACVYKRIGFVGSGLVTASGSDILDDNGSVAALRVSQGAEVFCFAVGVWLVLNNSSYSAPFERSFDVAAFRQTQVRSGTFDANNELTSSAPFAVLGQSFTDANYLYEFRIGVGGDQRWVRFAKAGGPAAPVIDVYDVPDAVRTAVTGGAFTNGELQGAQPAGSEAGMKFTTATFGYEYQRGAAGSLVWCRYSKG
ncbi:hypothetical protein [Hymenobacter coalescens]